MADMPDWTRSMQQTFEYYKVDPISWEDYEKIETVTSSAIDRDADTETKVSATIDITGELEECYVRIYLICVQDRATYKIPLATCLVQTPTKKYNGKYVSQSLDAYSPLTELKENYPPIGYSVMKNTRLMPLVSSLCEEHMRAPVVANDNSKILETDFTAEPDETWLSFINSLLGQAEFSFELDPTGEVLFAPIQDMASLQTVWTYDDDNSSILYDEIEIERDLYGIPNTIEIIFSKDSYYLYTKVINEDPNSPVSTVNRGRTITYRETNPDVFGIPNQQQLDDYAIQKLRNLSSLEYKITYSHAYCPVRVGDCVLLNYRRADFKYTRATVISQKIDCRPGCKVQETAVYTVEVGDKYKVVHVEDA